MQVALPEVAVVADSPSAEDELSPGSRVTTSSPIWPTPSGSMDRAVATRAALQAGVLGFFLGMLIPFLAIAVAGALAVFFYRRKSGLVLPPAFGSRLGGAAGVVAIAIQSIFFTVSIFVFHRQKEYIDSVTRFVHSVGGDASVPDIEASIRSMFTPAGLALTLFFAMIVGLVLASMGGALASVFLRPRNPRG